MCHDLLLQHGFSVGRYISLRRLVEESKEDYYRVLGECSQGWHEDRNPILPWWNHFLGMLRRAYVDFSRQVESSTGQPAKTELARRAILSQVGDFTLADIQAQLPGVSTQLLKKVLAEMKTTGQLSLTGRGRGAKWTIRQRQISFGDAYIPGWDRAVNSPVVDNEKILVQGCIAHPKAALALLKMMFQPDPCTQPPSNFSQHEYGREVKSTCMT